MPQYLSIRGYPLVYHGDPEERPILTTAICSKWYELYLLLPDGTVKAIAFSEPRGLPYDVSPFVDHVPNPIAVALFAHKHNYALDDEAMEMLIGRWEREVKNHYEETYLEILEDRQQGN